MLKMSYINSTFSKYGHIAYKIMQAIILFIHMHVLLTPVLIGYLKRGEGGSGSANEDFIGLLI